MVWRMSSSGSPRSQNIQWQHGLVGRAHREAMHGHRGVMLWLTGLSGSGKTTIAHGLEDALLQRTINAYVLDGDNLRHGLSRDLGFSPEERSEHIRRVGEVARLFVDAGLIVLCAFVSPFRADRDQLRSLMAPDPSAGANAAALPGDFVEVYVKASLEACRARDPKGLYRKAAAGKIADLTGVAAPYEPPLSPELVVDTERLSIADSLGTVLGYLEQHGYIPASSSAGVTSAE
jgi:adenylylsulfate kinase